MANTVVSGTLTYEHPDGRTQTIRFTPFSATTETPYVDLIDTAEQLIEMRGRMPKGDDWLQADERISEKEMGS